MINTLSSRTTSSLKSPTMSKFEHELEIELLLAVSRTQISAEVLDKIRTLVKQELHWERLIQLGNRHQLTPLIYHNLSRLCPNDIPAEHLAKMRQVYAYNAQKNLFVAAELIKIHRLFQAHNIAAIPFKGMTLAMTAYQNLSFRDSCDIDILISKTDFALATELLATLGYETSGYIAAVADNPDLRYGSFLQSENNQKGYDFVHPQKGIAIDLQWSLTEKAKSHYFSLDFEEILANTSEVTLADYQLPQFAPETMVLYLCFHGSKHCWQSLKWVCDLAEFIRSHPQLDWQKIEAEARRLKLTTMLHLGLLLAHNFYQAPEPSQFLIGQNSRVLVLFKQIKELIFSRRFTQWEDYAFVFKITDSWRGKLQFLMALLFTPTTKEWEEIKLPKALFPLYYLLRPYRLTKEYLFSSR